MADGPILINGNDYIHVGSFLYRDGDIFYLFASLIIFDNHVVGCEIVEIFDVWIEFDGWGRELFAFDELFDDWYMAVINVRIGNHMNECARFHADTLCDHHQQNAVLDNVPVVGG